MILSAMKKKKRELLGVYQLLLMHCQRPLMGDEYIIHSHLAQQLLGVRSLATGQQS